MAVSSRAASLALALVASALTVTGVVIAATDANPGGAGRDPLALNGYPPRSAQIALSISTGQEYHVTAEVNVNFVTNAVAAQVHVPLAFSNVGVNLLLVKKHLYVGLANLSAIAGSTWVSVPTGAPSLYGLSLEMTKPDIGLISGFTSKTVTKSGYLTTYRFERHDTSLSLPSNFPLAIPHRASVTFSITTGSQGELVAAGFSVDTAHSHASIVAAVTSYNQPATISAPPKDQVKVLDPTLLGRLFGSSSLGAMLQPGAISSLGQVQLHSA